MIELANIQSHLIVLAAGFAGVTVFVVLWWRPRRRARRQLLDLFGLDPREWRAVGSDLHGRELPAKKLAAEGVAGVPDAIFVHRRQRRVLVGDLKNRSASTPSAYERYQLVLYQGLAAASYPKLAPEGVIRYKNQLLLIPFERGLYDRLLGLRDEYRRSRRQKKPIDPRPLATRLQTEAADAGANLA